MCQRSAKVNYEQNVLVFLCSVDIHTMFYFPSIHWGPLTPLCVQVCVSVARWSLSISCNRVRLRCQREQTLIRKSEKERWGREWWRELEVGRRRKRWEYLVEKKNMFVWRKWREKEMGGRQQGREDIIWSRFLLGHTLPLLSLYPSVDEAQYE